MAMQQIGIPARKVIADIEAKRAGANPAKIGAADQASPGDDGDLRPAQDEPAHLLDDARGLAASSKGGTGKMASTEAPAKFHGRRHADQGSAVEVPRPVTASLPTIDRGMESVARRKQSGIPTRALSRPVLTVIIGGRHASTGI